MSYYEHDSFGRVILLCQLCKSKCHSGEPKKVNVPVAGSAGVYRLAECRQCLCHECIQVSDNPMIEALVPKVLGQTDHEKPLKLEQALTSIAGELGLLGAPARQALPRVANCPCGKSAKARCVSCDCPLCSKCVARHRCEP